MPDSPGQPPSSESADASRKPRPVASRHYRGPAANVPDAAPAPEGSGPDEAVAEGDTKQRRGPMPRSGNVNMSVLVGEAHTADDSPASILEPEAPRVVLPTGLGGLAWKLGVVALVMFGLGYLLATLRRPALPSDPQAVSAPEPPPVWRPAKLEVLGKAVAADRAGDLKTATALLSELAASQPNLPGLTRYLAELLVRQGNYIGADTILLAQANAGRELAQTLYLRAFNAARQRHFEDAAHYLEASLAQDPFSADAYFQLGEIMRRQGKWAEAIDNDRRASLRVRSAYGISPALIGLKMRLAQIEAGQAAEVEAALAEARKSAPLPAEWLFTAAALSLQKGDLAAAAESLSKARELMPRDDFNVWIEDYFFRAQTDKTDLAGFRPGEDDRRRRQQTTWEFNIDP